MLMARASLVKETNNNVMTDGYIDHMAESVPYDKIAENDHNLSAGSYVETRDAREKIDMSELNANMKAPVSKIDQLHSKIDAIVSEIEAD